MPRYELLVPAAPPEVPVELAVRLDAEHWLGALKAGLEKLGGAAPAANVLCDVQPDGAIDVTDPASGRVFRIRELAADGDDPVRPERRAAPGGPEPKGAAPPAIGRAPRPPPRSEQVLAELFERVMDLPAERQAGLEALLDLAMEKISCEAGTVFLAGLGGADLEFAAVRGPRAEELLSLGMTVPMGVGVVGFAARENVCVAVSDARRDPRFFPAPSRAIGYDTRSLLCAPIARKGRVLGALEVLNKQGGAPFEDEDLAVLSYLAHQAAELLERTA